MDGSRQLGKDTLLQHLGEDQKIQGAVVPPLFLNSLFVFDTQAEFTKAALDPLNHPHFYSRLGNPTVHLAEQKIAMLEGTEQCKLVSSGMAAITCAVMSCIDKGGHIVVVDTCYGPVHELLNNYLDRFGVTHTFVEGVCIEEIEAAIQDDTCLVYLESPSSLIFRLQDLEAVAKLCKARGITTIIDNTYATPLLQNPAAFGIDIVIHSATKYLGGHSDILAGAICTSTEKMDRILKKEINLFGSGLAAFPAWLLTRGLRTLKLRVAHHEKAGNEMAGWLEEQPWVDRVHHVGLPSFPQRELAKKQMKGSGGLLSFEPKVQDEAKVIKFVESLKLFGMGVSWGGFESLAVQVNVKPLHYSQHRRLVRMFVGLEDIEDLMADVTQAAEIAFA